MQAAGRQTGKTMILRRDHIAGGVFVVAGLLVVALSDDLPFGSLASPGAGMLPKLVLGIMIAFGALLVLRANTSPPMASISWNNLSHAARVIAVAAVGAALYTTLGFVITMMLVLFCLVYVVERQRLIPAAIFSIAVPIMTFALFEYVLKTPLERGLLGY
jgi:hypothetical protein